MKYAQEMLNLIALLSAVAICELNDKFMQAALRSIGPRDALEALLAVQMVRTHILAISDDRKGEAAQGCRASCDCPAYPLPTLAFLVWPSPHRPDDPQWV